VRGNASEQDATVVERWHIILEAQVKVWAKLVSSENDMPFVGIHEHFQADESLPIVSTDKACCVLVVDRPSHDEVVGVAIDAGAGTRRNDERLSRVRTRQHDAQVRHPSEIPRRHKDALCAQRCILWANPADPAA
jgi:hypothetical protein